MQYYEDEQVEEFILIAQQLGISGAMKHLGFPASRATANYWLKQRNIVLDKDVLAQRAAEFKHFYTDQEHLTALNTGLQRAYELLENDRLTASDLQKVVNTIAKTIETIRLIGGQSTQTIQTIDSMDQHIKELLNQFEQVEVNE